MQHQKKKKEKKNKEVKKEVDWDIYTKKRNCKCEMCVSIADKI